MQAIRVHQFGDTEQLRYEEIPLPTPAAGEVRIKVEAAGLNFIDIYQRRGWYPMPTPFTPGVEGAGVVDAVGAGVTDLQAGDRVGFNHPGSYADYLLVPAAKLVSVPAGLDTRQVAAVMLQGMTAHYLCRSTYPIRPGDTALVHAAAGGVGLLLVQMIKQMGGRVIGTASTAEKIELATAAGADQMVNYTHSDFEQAVKEMTDGAGVEVVYDSVGKETFAKSMNCLKPRGMLVLYGQASGPVDSLDPQILNQKGSLFLTRPSLGHYTLNRAELLERAADLFHWMQAGTLDVRVDREFPLAQAADAHRYMEARRTKGKVILIP